MLKKLALATLAVGALSTAAVAVNRAEAGNDDTAAIILSTSFPGVGEWYRAGFSGGFPLVECILGSICPCVRISSLVDAAAGKTDDSVRFDFWSSPA
jgi:hypothetical protein